MLFRTVCTLFALALGAASGIAHADDEAQRARGREILFQSGCHDCHTPGFAANGGEAPEAAWLVGDQLGWNGPWGTTYPTNLRLRLNDMSRAQWLAFAKAMKARPPMPYWALNRMSDADLGAIWLAVRALGKAGTPAPAALPPGVSPQGPVVRFPPPPQVVKAAR
ncbi:hypothetical protein DFR29_102340 [Tahibacter aquaticus]|uniref:Cytochrome c domain-containing protein n=1 Tax=Tahibacter aquaticus TaxID=520092 RepID=A0A4R6Z7A1_9GAMM|nr:cytochrome C [Tahibacter aquaticus]TDR47680.1 hypothetical protein DFR29_102340 [Tahibacter aquaticus]